MEKAQATELPVELAGYVPRAVRLSAGGRAVVMGAVALAVTGVVIPAVMWVDRERKAELRARIEREGVAAVAEVTRTGKTGGEHPERFADYRFGDYVGRVVLRDRDRRAWEVGDAIQVRYLPGDPSRSWAVGYEPAGVPLGALPAVAGTFFVGPAFIVMLVRRQWRLLAEGRATMGRVVAVKRSRNSEGGTNYRAEYEVTLLSGAVRRIWAAGDKRLAVGAVVPVVYDAENPKRLARYPMPLVRVVRE